MLLAVSECRLLQHSESLASYAADCSPRVAGQGRIGNLDVLADQCGAEHQWSPMQVTASQAKHGTSAALRWVPTNSFNPGS